MRLGRTALAAFVLAHAADSGSAFVAPLDLPHSVRQDALVIQDGIGRDGQLASFTSRSSPPLKIVRTAMSPAAPIDDDISTVPSISEHGGMAVSSGYNVDEMTSAFLDKTRDSVGSLAPETIESVVPVCVAWSRLNSGLGARVVEKIVARAMQEREVGSEEAAKLPWQNLYTVAINAWAKSDEQGSAARAESLLESMKTDDEISLRPSAPHYNAVIKAFARQAAAGDPDAAAQAERLLCQMENMGAEDEECGIEPNTITYTTVIDAFAKAGGKDAAKDAERIFRQMEKAYESGCSDARPNVRSFNAVINAWAQSGKANGSLRAEELLRKMMELYANGREDMEPTVVSFTTVMNGWAKSEEDGATNRAVEIFHLMNEMHEAGTCQARPNAFTYSVLIDALVRDGKLQQAEDVFRKNVEEYKKDEDSPKPNKIQLSQIMDGWAKSGDSSAGAKAEALLSLLESLYEAYGDDVMKPNVITYCTAINAVAKSKAFGKAQKARDILNRMISAYEAGNIEAKPNVNAYTAVLNACAFTLGDVLEKKEALQIASTTYKELCASDYGDPNEFTYATFLRVCSNIIPSGPSRVSSMKSVFNKCCNDGKVENLVLKVLQGGLSREEFQGMLPVEVPQRGPLNLSCLPSEWTCNVRQQGQKKTAARGQRNQRRRR